ncbi:MAG: hypothetical protein ABR505_00075 [Actinomycetota bacterium]
MALIVAMAVAGTGCANERASEPAAPLGSAEVEPAAVQQHARQFDSELSPRGPGSQQEFAAAAYIVGHLQQAGYVARLDPVPVANLVESSNVIALAPGADASVLVVVPYDDSARGETIGLWLELARALRVGRADHHVQLVALGAEDGDPGRGGTRRLIRVLKDGEEDPEVLTLAVIPEALEVTASGNSARALMGIAADMGIDARVVELDADDLWSVAGFEHTRVEGRVHEVGALLLRFLATEDS